MKNTILEMQPVPDGINWRWWDSAEENISGCEDIAKETVRSEVEGK